MLRSIEYLKNRPRRMLYAATMGALGFLTAGAAAPAESSMPASPQKLAEISMDLLARNAGKEACQAAVKGYSFTPSKDFMLDYYNDIRAVQTLTPLTINPVLQDSAQTTAQYLKSKHTLMHVHGPQAGLELLKNELIAANHDTWAKIGENVSKGSFAEAECQYVQSPLHYKNIVDPAFTQVGIGLTTGNHPYTAVHFAQFT